MNKVCNIIWWQIFSLVIGLVVMVVSVAMMSVAQWLAISVLGVRALEVYVFWWLMGTIVQVVLWGANKWGLL